MKMDEIRYIVTHSLRGRCNYGRLRLLPQDCLMLFGPDRCDHFFCSYFWSPERPQGTNGMKSAPKSSTNIPTKLDAKNHKRQQPQR